MTREDIVMAFIGILVVAAIAFAMGCTPTVDIRIHRLDGTVEKVETWREKSPSTYTVCEVSKVTPKYSILDCMETELR